MLLAGSGTFWLITVNVLLGAVTLGILFLVAGAAVNDAMHRYSARRAARREDEAMFRRLGITMPDGGRPIDEMDELHRQEPERRTPTL